MSAVARSWLGGSMGKILKDAPAGAWHVLIVNCGVYGARTFSSPWRESARDGIDRLVLQVN